MSDSPCDGCIGQGLDRREFVAQAALTAAAVLLAACTEGREFLAGPPRINVSIKVGDFPGLANVNGATSFTRNNVPIAVVRTGATTFLALSRVCPHEAALIVSAADSWFCTGHGARFRLTGEWFDGQDTFDMARWPTSYDATTDILTIGGN